MGMRFSPLEDRKRSGKTPALSGVCGIDEAGRGPVVGPLVVAGVLARDMESLRQLGVKDSKVLSHPRRVELDLAIREICRVHLRQLTAADVDARGERSLNSVETQVFGEITRRLRPREVFLDAVDYDEEGFGNRVKHASGLEVDVVSEHRADSTYPVVSAASIVAKVRRDSEIRRIEAEVFREWPGSPPLGSGYPGDPKTITCIRTWIKERGLPPPHTRISWATTRRLLAESKAMMLENWQH